MSARFQVSAFSLLAALLASHGAQAEPAAPSRPDEVTVTVLTFTPAAHLFLLFGHTSLWIHDPRLPLEERDLVYNFGTFAFGSPQVLPDFFRGKLRYWLSIAPLDWTLREYGAEGRGVRAQELDLSFAEADGLERELIARAEPDRRFYAYGYVVDNCTTRVRDVLDDATRGALRRSVSDLGRGSPATSYREEVARITADRLGPSLFLDAAMGPAMDRPQTAWDATFLPAHLETILPRITRISPAGSPLPLVRRDYVVQSPARPLPRTPSGARTPLLFALAALIGGAALGLRARVERGARERLAFALFIGAWGIATALLGGFWLFLGALSPWLRFNVNVLAVAPSLLLLARHAPGIERGEARATQRARAIALTAWVGTAAAIILEASQVSAQKSLPLLAAFLLLWSGVAQSLRAGADLGEASLRRGKTA